MSSSACILEVVVPERARSTQEVIEPEVSKIDLAIEDQKDQESHMRLLLISAFILGATMLGAMASTLLIWAYLR